MPTQNAHDSKPRNPKRCPGCRNEEPGSRHARLERKHDKREKEREAIATGAAGTVIMSRLSLILFLTCLPPHTHRTNTIGGQVPSADAGPNWAKNREAALAKYARRTRRRHNKHEKRQRDMQKREAEGREGATLFSPNSTSTTNVSAREAKRGA